MSVVGIAEAAEDAVGAAEDSEDAVEAAGYS